MMRLIFMWSAVLLASCGLFSNPDKVELRTDAGVDLDVGLADDGAMPNNVPPDVGDVDPPAATCGDGLLQPDEVCDPALPPESAGACPTACDDGASCTTDELVGAPGTCDAACRAIPIEVCLHNDGCCPSNCSPENDTDCDENAVCGDGVVTGAERCDPGIDDPDAGNCPDDAAACFVGQCQMPRVIGAPQNCDAECAFVAITACVTGDGCCPMSCDESNDQDCASVCGNGLVEPGEGCDGNCPTAAECDDGEACTINTLTGAASSCDAACETTEITTCVHDDGCCPAACDSGNDNDCSPSCGNDVIDPGETCDPRSNCPSSCDDGNACTTDLTTGSPANCNVVCSHTNITACKAIPDGCCPPGCTANNDFDCDAVCGNGVIEAGEACDGNCPASCDDQSVCTIDTTSGAAQDCTLTCTNTTISVCTNGDGCCPNGCNAINDDDCGAVCGNAISEPGELCDGNCPATCNDGNACTVDVTNGSAAQCNVECTYLFVSSCVDADGCCPSQCNANNDTDCSPSCGNGITEGNETCDGNCPTSANCTSVNPCTQLSGSPGQCNVQCTPIAGCETCSFEPGECGCGASEICGGICAPGDGTRCDRACDPFAYCEIFSGVDASCNSLDGFCVRCTTQCEDYQICRANDCITPMSCEQSPDPALWCLTQKGGGACVGKKCM